MIDLIDRSIFLLFFLTFLSITIHSQSEIHSNDISIDDFLSELTEENLSISQIKAQSKQGQLHEIYQGEIDKRLFQLEKINTLSLAKENRLDTSSSFLNIETNVHESYYEKLYLRLLNWLYLKELGMNPQNNSNVANEHVMKVYLNQIRDKKIQSNSPQPSKEYLNLQAEIVKLKEFQISLSESIDFMRDELRALKNQDSKPEEVVAINVTPEIKVEETKLPAKSIKKQVPKNKKPKPKYSRIQKEIASINQKGTSYNIDYGKDNKSFEDRKGFMRWPMDKAEKLTSNNSSSWQFKSESPYAYCVSQGQVVYLGKSDRSPYMAIIQHDNGYITVYDNLQNAYLNTSQRIAEGQLIGDLKPNGNSYTLHFEIWKNTKQLNPSRWLKNN